jgi:hypothetical protein
MTKRNLGDILATDENVEPLPPPPPQGEKMLTIALEENDNIPPTGQFFSLNGRTWMLRPGEPAEVPMGLVNILNDAVMEVPNVDPVTRQIVGYRKKLRFPFRLVNLATV